MKYISPEIQIIGVQAMDILTTSGLTPEESGNSNDNPVEWL